MNRFPEGNAVVYCEGAFGTTNGKTAHGLVRRSERYRVQYVVDSRFAGQDAGMVLDGRWAGIPIYRDLASALAHADAWGPRVSHFVIGLAPDGGRLDERVRMDVLRAVKARLHIVSGLHDFLSEDPEAATLAAEHGVHICDVRKPPPRNALHSFTGKIEEVTCLKVAVLGTDSAVGKRTTAWRLVDAFSAAGYPAELVGTGQTAWMQGARHGIILDSLISDFMAGEIEHAVWCAWQAEKPAVIVIEGQGSLMNPAYPGGTEILAAGRPDVVVLQHAPGRKKYDGFPAYPIHPLAQQIAAIELLSGKPVVAVTINPEGLSKAEVPTICSDIQRETGLPVCDALRDNAGAVVAACWEREKPPAGCGPRLAGCQVNQYERHAEGKVANRSTAKATPD